MTSQETKGLELVKVKTTLPALPYLPLAERPPVNTGRLVLRTFRQDDLQAIHELRTDNEVMKWTYKGVVDASLEETQEFLNGKLFGDAERNQTFAITLAETGELIGTGGVHNRSGHIGWPEIGYMLKTKHQGNGYATEFLTGLLKFWWTLPRENAEVDVMKETVADYGASGIAIECISAMVESDNTASHKVATKAGLTVGGNYSDNGKKGLVHLSCFVARRPQSS